jgi:hypothetical protein
MRGTRQNPPQAIASYSTGGFGLLGGIISWMGPPPGMSLLLRQGPERSGERREMIERLADTF